MRLDLVHPGGSVFAQPRAAARPACRCSPTSVHCAGPSAPLSDACVEPSSSGTWRAPLREQAAARGQAGGPAFVALGKFDALHKGHRALCVRAADAGAQPWLISFSNMAAVLGWEERLPLVAPQDRPSVLASWSDVCGGRVPQELLIPFAEVRGLSPQAFVELLARQLGAAGVVVGDNYRFGYRAAGDAAMLKQLGAEYGMRVEVLSLVGAYTAGVVGVVSSSKVREALAEGRMGRVADLLGRPYRLTAAAPRGACELRAGGEGAAGPTLCVPASALCNQPPAEGIEYGARVSVTDSTTGAALLDPAHAAVRLTGEGLQAQLPAPLELGDGAVTVRVDFDPSLHRPSKAIAELQRHGG